MKKLPVALFVLISLNLLWISTASSQSTIRLDVDQYQQNSSEKVSSWVMMEVKSDNLTSYKLAEDDNDNQVIKAVSDNAAGGLIFKKRIDPEEYPIIEWRWKVDGIVEKGDLLKKEGDDYAARIYITFDYDKSDLSFGDRLKYAAIKTFSSYEVPLRSLNYIWANKADQGTIAPNPFTDWVYMIAVQSGKSKTGEWIVERRNILKDYRAAFGEDPPAITGIAIMTDTDNTGGAATAYYGDIIFHSAEGAQTND